MTFTLVVVYNCFYSVTGIRKFNSNTDQIPVIYVGHKLICSYCQTQFSLSSIFGHINSCSKGEHGEQKKLFAWKRKVSSYAKSNEIDYNNAE